MIDLYRFLRSLPTGRLTMAELVCEANLEGRCGDLAIHHVPFNYHPVGARLALVGITPGFEQMRMAYEFSRDNFENVADRAELIRLCNSYAGFGGPLRRNLVRMLDELGVGSAMGVATTDELFEANRDDVIRTSVIEDAVFVGGKNYTGHSPRIVDSAFLMNYARDHFANGIEASPQALIVPMGKAVEDALRELRLPNPVLWGFPHPSGANGHRLRHFAERKELLCRAVMEWS